MIQTHGHVVLNSSFFHPEWYSCYCQSFNCSSDFISRVLILLQKANNAVVRYHFSEMPFLWGGIFNKRSVFFKTSSMGAINVRWLQPFWSSASVRYFRLRYLAISCSVICRILISMRKKRSIRGLYLKIQFSAIFP